MDIVKIALFAFILLAVALIVMIVVSQGINLLSILSCVLVVLAIAVTMVQSRMQSASVDSFLAQFTPAAIVDTSGMPGGQEVQDGQEEGQTVEDSMAATESME